MGIIEILRRLWLFSANKIKSSESGSKQLTQLIIAAHNCHKNGSKLQGLFWVLFPKKIKQVLCKYATPDHMTISLNELPYIIGIICFEVTPWQPFPKPTNWNHGIWSGSNQRGRHCATTSDTDSVKTLLIKGASMSNYFISIW